jgi:signal transduction histidine kinase
MASVSWKGPWSEALSRVREPFVRAGATSGSGLGLSLIDSITRALGGELQLQNTPAGFEAALTLPVAVPARQG